MFKNPAVKIAVIVVIIVIILSLGYFAYVKSKKKEVLPIGGSGSVIDQANKIVSASNDKTTTTAQDVAQLSVLQTAVSALNYQLVQASRYITTLPEDQRAQAQTTINTITASINSYNDRIATLQSKMNLAAISNSLQ